MFAALKLRLHLNNVQAVSKFVEDIASNKTHAFS